jgi:hypothetical protein
MRGESASAGAFAMRNVTGGNAIYEGTLELLSGNAVGLVFRSSSDGLSSYDAILDAVDGVFKISKRTPYEVLQSHSMTVERNRPYRVKVVANGGTIEAYLDDVKLLTAEDSAYSSGQFGVHLWRATGTFDELRAQSLP